MKAFIFDPLWDELVTDELLTKLNENDIELIITKEIAPLSNCAALFEGNEERLLCLNPDYVGWKLTSNDYKNIPNLKAVFGAATSTSWIDKTYANDNNIPVCDIRNFSTEAVAEWAMTMLLNVARQTPKLIKDDFPLDFDKDFMKYRGVELHGRTVGIIGLGHIGSAIAKRCEGLGMNVIYWSRSLKTNDYERKELDEIFKSADVILPTVELNDETRKLITPDLLVSMKSTAMLISVVHELFDEKLVLEMVKENRLFGFGFEAEPSSFKKYEGNVWAAPSYAWATDQTMHNSMVLWVDNMINAAHGNFPNKVN